VTNGPGASVASAPITLTVIVLPSVTLAQWGFNDTNAPLTSPPPTAGTGTASLLNGVTATFAGGVSSDPGGTNEAWNTATYPPQGTSNKTAGVQFNVSTLGYQNILLSWNERHSPTGSKYIRLQYSTNGTAFTDLDLNTISTDGTFFLFTRDLSALPAVNNNASFAFRIVSDFESDANLDYVGTTSGYSASGTIRFDLVSVYGNSVGAPTLASTTISNIIGTTLTYGGGAGSQFVLLKSTNVAALPSGWDRLLTNTVTPRNFTIPAVGTGTPVFYRIKSE
jgi:hypothetical protein